MSLCILVSLFLLARAGSASFEIADPQPGTATHPVPTAIASNGDGFVLYWLNQYRDLNTDVVAVDRNGRAGKARTTPTNVLGATRLGDRYLIRVAVPMPDGQPTSALYEAAADGSPIGLWSSELPSNAVIGVMATTTDGETLLLIDTTIAGRTFITNRQGRLLGVHTLPVSTHTGVVQITGTPTGFIHLTSGWGGIFVQSVPADGRPPGDRIRVDSPSTGVLDQLLYATAASSGDETMVIWTRGSWTATPILTLAVVKSDGTIARRVLPLSHEWIQHLAVEWTESNYLLVGNAGRNPSSSDPGRADMVALRLDRRGEAIDQLFHAVIGPDGPISMWTLVTNGSRIYVVGREYSPIGSRAVGVLFNAGDGISAVTAEPLFLRGAAQTFPRAATDGVDSLIVWREATADWQGLRAVLVSPRGERRSDAVELTRNEGFIGDHDVAFGDGMYALVWVFWKYVFAVRFDRNGKLLDESPILVDPEEQEMRGRPAVIWTGTTFLVVWSEGRLVGTTLSPSGAVGGKRPMTAALPPHSSDRTPVLASDGSRVLLAWTRLTLVLSGMPCGDCGEYSVRSAIVDVNGVPVAESERLVVREGRSATVASSGTDFMVAYETTVPRYTVGAVRLSRENEPAGGIELTTGGSIGSIAAAGQDYLITFSRRADSVVSVARVKPDGSTRTSVTPARAPLFYFGESITANAAGELLITLPQFVETPADPQRTWRVIGYGNHDLAPAGRLRAVRR